MNLKPSLLGGAAVCAVALAMAATPAAAKPKTAEQAQIEALQAQVQALTARLDAAEAASQSAQAQAADAQTQAAAAAAQAQAAQAQTSQQIQTIPAQVQTAVAALPKPKTSWADSTTISGRMYYNLSNIEQKSNGNKVAPSGLGFDIKRFYVGVDHKFNDVYSANLTMDFQYSSAISSTEFFIKKAYLQAKYSDALTLRLGATDLPWIPFAEDVYGYRFVEQTVSDRTKFGTSSDWGVHALGNFAGGKISYQLSLVDGAGYKAPLRSKGMDIEGRVSAKLDNFVFGVGGYSGKLGKDIQGGVPTFHTATRFNALAAYVTKKFRIGGEYFSTEDWTTVTSPISDSSKGYSVFGSYYFTPQISAFGRYDWVKPNEDTAPNKKDNYFNIGIDYQPTKIVDFALVYKRDEVERGTLSTGNGTIGGAKNGTYDEIGLFGQVRW
jgi:hypothetical protein